MIVRDGLVQRNQGGRSKSGYRSWFLVKYKNAVCDSGIVDLATTYLPAEYVGKRVRFRVEVIEDD